MKNYLFSKMMLATTLLVLLASCSPKKVDVPALIAQGEKAYYEQDFVKAKNIFKECADLGDSKGQFWLAFLTANTYGRYSETDTLQMNAEERVKYCFDLFKKSADQNDADGIFGLYLCYSSGSGVEINNSKAIEYLDKSVKMDCAYALAILLVR